MKASVGRIVHYVAFGTPGGEFPAGVCRAAVITEVSQQKDGETVGLAVLNPTGQFFNRGIRQDELDGTTRVRAPGTWHWPERVD